MISPQGYSLGEEPKSTNPFWGSGEDGNVNMIFATGELQGQTGDGPASVQTSKTIDGHNITFGFLFKNIIGKNGVSPTVTVTNISGGHRVAITDATSTHTFDIMDGEQGEQGENGVSPDVSVREIVGGHIVTITDAMGSESFTVMNGQDGGQGEQGPAGTTPEITITATQDGQPVTVTKTGSGATQNFEFALTGGGSASGDIGWGNYGPEVAGRYPRSIKQEYKLDNAITVNGSGQNTVYIMGTHSYDYTLTGTLPLNFIVGTKYTPEMTPGGSQGMYIPTIMGDPSLYLTPTVTPQDEMTVDNVRVELTSLYKQSYDQSLQITAAISFDAHYSGQDMPGQTVNVTIQASMNEWETSNAYAYLEILPGV